MPSTAGNNSKTTEDLNKLTTVSHARISHLLLAFVLTVLAATSIRAADELKPGLIAEFFALNEPLVNFPVIPPDAIPTYRRIDASIDFETARVFPGTDLVKTFYARWHGVIRISKTGFYRFHLSSDDGSSLSINGSEIVNNSGAEPWLGKTGEVALEAGDHTIDLEYFQDAGPMSLELSWQTDDSERTVVPASVLYHSSRTARNVERPLNGLAGRPSENTQRSWSASDGLPHNAVHSVIQSRDGYLWMGTTAGVARFDGHQFTVFNPVNTPELKSAFIRYLKEARDGTLWFAGETGGLTSLKHGRFTHHPTPKDALLRAISESRTGEIWIGTTRGWARITDQGFVWTTKADGLMHDEVLSFCEDRSGNLWIGTAGGLSRFNDGFKDFFHDHFYLPANAVRTLLNDSQGNLWIGTSGGGVARLRDGKWSYFKKPQGLPDVFVTSILEDRRGQIWVGTLGGLCRLSGEKFLTEVTNEGTSYESVYAIIEDNEGSLWIGTKEGLHQLRHRVFKSYTRQNGLSHNNVMSVREDRNGSQWVASWGGGVNRIRNNQIAVYNFMNDGLPDLILSIGETRDGSMWFGAEYDSGLFRLKDGLFTHYNSTNGLKDPAIRVIHEDRKGDLWLGTRGGLYRMQGETFQKFTTEHGLAGNIIRAICETKDGALWIGTDGGLSMCPLMKNGISNDIAPQFVSFTGKNFLPNGAVLSIYEDKERDLWIGIEGQGLFRSSPYSHSNPGKLNGKHYKVSDGLFSHTIFEILEDDLGLLWMSSSLGIFRVAKTQFSEFDAGRIRTITGTSFGKADGMASIQCNGVSKPAGWKAKDGSLWFATTRGIVTVDPGSVRANTVPPPVLIQKVVADKQVIGTEEALNIPAGRGELEIHYTALSFKAPERNRFRYKLDGIDSDWVEAETRRSAFYNNLPPGAYRFNVIGCNSDGVWNDIGATVHITLQPHFWQTKWFLGVALCAAVLGVGSVGRYAAWSRLQRRLKRLEQQHAIEKERTRIAQDMHDDLGARLSEILLLSSLSQKPDAKAAEVKSQLSRIGDAARDLVDNLDAIVWAVNPRNDSFDKFVFYLFEYVPRYLETSSIRSFFDLPDPLPPTPLPSAVRHNLFLVVKEALHNVVKHAQAKEVRLMMKIEKDALLMSLSDNGRGFIPDNASGLGNGLPGMKERVEGIGGIFELTTGPQKGTKIQIRVRLGASGLTQ